MEAFITITGNVGSDVEIRAGGNNEWAFANFRVACTPRSRGAEGWQDELTIWYRVRCGYALANHVKASISRGDPVIVVGRLRTVSWVDADGVTHTRTEIDAQHVGHDLTRGTAEFRRMVRAAEPPSESARDEFETEPDGVDVDPGLISAGV